MTAWAGGHTPRRLGVREIVNRIVYAVLSLTLVGGLFGLLAFSALAR